MASSSFLSPHPHALRTHFFSHFSPFPSLLRDFSSPRSLPRTRANNVAERIPQREQTHPHKNKAFLLSPSRSIDDESEEHGDRKQWRWLKNEREGGKSKKAEANSAVLENKKKAEEEKVKKKGKKAKVNPQEFELRINLDMCSKTGDVMGAISLYDSASKEGFEFGQYHYNVLLYLCSSAAMGVIHPAKSGTGNSNNSKDSLISFQDGTGAKELVMDETGECEEKSTNGGAIQVSDDIRDYARNRGFEIYEKMCLEKIPMSEAALTSVARMAMSTGNGDLAFDIVKQMKASGITPRLRSYAPALLAFCDGCDVEKAFEVERHMSESGVQLEEPELEALLRASVRARRGEKVYYLLHKLRTDVRQVSPSTADLIQTWFKSVTASRVGKRKWEGEMVDQAMENGGGGWHGLGWLGKGKWAVARTTIDDDGVCVNCGEKLVTIDLDPNETENFARSVASIASKRERNSSFQKFQKWLDYYGPFEAVVDAANVGLFSQRQFSLTKVNAVVNAVRQKLPSKKCPLIILHNRRLIGRKMNEPINGKLIEKWKNADAIYATPTGSNDDWYWLYAAIKCRCLIVTNDEMRDHVFHILGNDFFPRWKERHQVRFNYRDGNFELQFPPPCSVVIQESKKGHWHIPILDELDIRRESTWLCVTRGISHKRGQISSISHKEMNSEKTSKSTSDVCSSSHLLFDSYGQWPPASDEHPNEKIDTGHQRYTATNNSPKSYACIISKIEAAEKLSRCVIDFQI